MTPRPPCPAFETATSLSRTPAAAPLSSAAAARWMPSAIGRHLAGNQQRGGGVQQHDVARRARLAAEDGAGDGGVVGGVAAAQRLRRRFRQAEVRRVHVERVHRARRGTPRPWCSRSSRSRRGRRRRARPTRARTPSSASDRATSSVSSGRGTPTSCREAPAGLVSGPEQVEGGAHAQLAPRRRRMPHRRMKRRREEERDPGLVQAALDDRRARR